MCWAYGALDGDGVGVACAMPTADDWSLLGGVADPQIRSAIDYWDATRYVRLVRPVSSRCVVRTALHCYMAAPTRKVRTPVCGD